MSDAPTPARAPHTTPPDLGPHLARVLGELKSELRARFADRLDGVTLFGSRAWGRPHPGSDVDVCIVIDGLTHREHVEVVELVADLCIREAVDVSPLVWSREHMRRALSTEQRLAIDIVGKGVAL